MNACIASPTAVTLTHVPSAAARQRMLASRGEPLFIAGWRRALMIHFEVEPEALQRAVPFPLDLRNGRAYVSLVAFTMCSMRPQVGGEYSAWLFRPIATHDFLNVRTYVRQAGEPGIHFLAEWLTSWLAVKLGPLTFGLPYITGALPIGMIGRRVTWRGRLRMRVTAPGWSMSRNLGTKPSLSPVRRARWMNGSWNVIPPLMPPAPAGGFFVSGIHRGRNVR